MRLVDLKAQSRTLLPLFPFLRLRPFSSSNSIGDTPNHFGDNTPIAIAGCLSNPIGAVSRIDACLPLAPPKDIWRSIANQWWPNNMWFIERLRINANILFSRSPNIPMETPHGPTPVVPVKIQAALVQSSRHSARQHVVGLLRSGRLERLSSPRSRTGSSRSVKTPLILGTFEHHNIYWSILGVDCFWYHCWVSFSYQYELKVYLIVHPLLCTPLSI